eukprot:15462914-Alexandrium_andersonii.AAC.1
MGPKSGSVRHHTVPAGGHRRAGPVSQRRSAAPRGPTPRAPRGNASDCGRLPVPTARDGGHGGWTLR